MGDSGTFGFKALKNRALELPAGVTEGLAVANAPTDRARFRYNKLAKQLEVSIDGGDYFPIAFGGQGALSQPAFFIDPTNGDDAAAGTSAATAIRTWAEYESRIGDGVVSVAQVVNLLGNLNEGVYRIRGAYPLGLTIQGQRTVIHSGSVTGVQNWNVGVTPPVDGRITDAALTGEWSNSGPGGTSLIGKALVYTSGAQAGRVTYTLADLSAISAKTARVNDAIDVFTFASGMPLVGDGYDVVDLTQMNGTILFEDRDVPGIGFVDLEDVEVVSSTGPALRGISGSIGAGVAIIRQTGGPVASLSYVAANFVGTFFNRCHLGLTQSDNFAFFNCSFRDTRILLENAMLLFDMLNPSQRVAAGAGFFGASDALAISIGGRARVSGSFGACDIGVASQAVVRVNVGGALDAIGTGVIWSVLATAGFGVWVDAMASALWTAGTSAVVHYRFDGGTEFRVGGVNTTAVALAGAGTVTAANNAVAVPHPT
jgi:hypothetical protein